QLLVSIHYLDARCNTGEVHALLADFGLTSGEGELAETLDFLLAAAQKLERRRDILFSRIRHEGPPAVRRRTDARPHQRRWTNPGLHPGRVPLPPSSERRAGSRVHMPAQLHFPITAAITLAEHAEVVFRLDVLGRICPIDARRMRDLSAM